MGVLFFGSRLGAYSHLWMRRMVDMIADHVALIVDFEEIPEPYESRFDALILGKVKPKLPRPLDRLRKAYEIRCHSRTLARAAARSDVHCIFVHFLVYAVRYRQVWEASNKPVFVHCHGWDVTWDLQRARPGITGRTNVHPPGYQEAVRALPANVTFIANSRTTAESLEGIGVSPDRIIVKYLGVPCKAGPRRWSGALPEPRDSLTVLYLGRFSDFKGPDATIRAFARARERGFMGRLVMAGDGPLQPVCQRLIKELDLDNHVELTGAVTKEQGEELRGQADLFTAHSQTGPSSGQREALGVAFLEAMADGLPVVTGRSGSLGEIVDDGETGILFEPGDVEAHAQALLTLSEDRGLRTRMGRAGVDRVRREFSLDAEKIALHRLLGLPRAYDVY